MAINRQSRPGRRSWRPGERFLILLVVLVAAVLLGVLAHWPASQVIALVTGISIIISQIYPSSGGGQGGQR